MLKETGEELAFGLGLGLGGVSLSKFRLCASPHLGFIRSDFDI